MLARTEVLREVTIRECAARITYYDEMIEKRRERQDITIYCKNEELPSSQIAVMRVITLKESFDTSPYYQILT